MSEKQSNPFTDHPTIAQSLLLISLISSVAGVLTNIYVLVAVSIGLFLFAYINMRVPKKFAPNSFEFRPTLNGVIFLLLAIACSAYSIISYRDELQAEKAAANIHVDSTLVNAYEMQDLPDALKAYGSRSGNSMPWETVCENKLDRWSNRPKNFEVTSFVEYNNVPNTKKIDYLIGVSKLFPLSDVRLDSYGYDINNKSNLADITLERNSFFDSFSFDIKLEDQRELACWIENLQIKVHCYRTLPRKSQVTPTSSASMTFSRDETVVMYVPIENLAKSLPWVFNATASTSKSSSLLPVSMEIERPAIRNRSIREVLVRIIPRDPGFYAFSAAVFIKDSRGNIITKQLIPEDRPRSIMVMGYPHAAASTDSHPNDRSDLRIDEFYRFSEEYEAKHTKPYKVIKTVIDGREVFNTVPIDFDLGNGGGQTAVPDLAPPVPVDPK